MKNNILTPQYDHKGIFLRKTRSFVCRQGRITKSQLNAIKKYWSLIGIDFQLKPLNFSSIFHNSNVPVILEIGFGSGHSLVETAIKFPNKNFLGIEVYKSGIGSCLNLIYTSKIQNLRIIYHDAVEVIKYMISDYSLSTIQIFFPDPWDKKRHNKRRLIQNNFLKMISKKLIIHGILHILTDSKEYANYILDQIKNMPNYKYLSNKNNFSIYPVSHIITNFEKKALIKGNHIFNLIFESNI